MSDRNTKAVASGRGAPSPARKLSAGAYRLGRGLADRLGLRNTSAGRQAQAALNILGQIAARQILFRGRRPIEVDGQSVRLAGKHAPSPALASALIEGHYEGATRRLIETLLPEGGTFIDIGAHVGLYTLAAARRVGPSGRVFAFEPEPDNRQLLRENIRLNGYRNVTIVPLAVCDRSGESQLFVSRQGNDRHSLFRNPSSPLRESTETVHTTTLDDFLVSARWPEIDLVKMDIEGAEPLAIDGMRGLIERSSRLRMIVEFSPGMLEAGGASPRDFLAALADRDMELFTIEDDGSLVPLRASEFREATGKIRARGVINLFCRKGKPGQPDGAFAHSGRAGERS
ncbi:MAG TPA: FkbM family methyltransferase [Patescibacteria group bacterium]|nr:FkbM family methyltransferase [Patescibacteria group bacterium]